MTELLERANAFFYKLPADNNPKPIEELLVLFARAELARVNEAIDRAEAGKAEAAENARMQGLAELVENLPRSGVAELAYQAAIDAVRKELQPAD